jgi:hypothetical protein
MADVIRIPRRSPHDEVALRLREMLVEGRIDGRRGARRFVAEPRCREAVVEQDLSRDQRARAVKTSRSGNSSCRNTGRCSPPSLRVIVARRAEY